MFTAAGATASLANQMSALIIFNHPNYNSEQWHMAALMWGFILIPLVFNLFFRKLLNTFETVAAILHVVFFFATIVTLTVLAERSTNDFVFKTIVTGVSGWTNPGISFGIGLLTVVLPLAGEILSNAHFGKELLTTNRCRWRPPHEYNLPTRLLCWILY
jgi:choline transport protein